MFDPHVVQAHGCNAYDDDLAVQVISVDTGGYVCAVTFLTRAEALRLSKALFDAANGAEFPASDQLQSDLPKHG